MRSIKKLVAVLRALAVVMAFVAVVSTIYNLATTGTTYKTYSDKLTAMNAKPGFVVRLKYDSAKPAAMSAAAATKGETNAVRLDAVKNEMQAFEVLGLEAEAAKAQADVQAVINYLNNEFDAAAYIAAASEETTSVEDILALKEIFEYLDGLAAPAGGKKVAKIKLVDNRPVFEEAYAAWEEAHGDVGTFLEFSQTVQAIVDEQNAAGAAITNAGEYLTATLTYEDYMVKLAAVQEANGGDKGASFGDQLVELCEKKLAGEAVDFEAFLKAQYETLKANYTDITASYELFVITVRSQLDSTGFDGSYAAIRSALATAQEAAKANSFAVFMNDFNKAIVTEADESGSIGFFAFLWKVVSLYWLWYVLALVLVILSKVLDILLSLALVSRKERKHVEEDPNVLLRVSHLKQYFRSGDYVNKAVDDVSFYVKKGEVFGLVGESGCGKTTTGRTIINLYDPTDGDVYFQGLRISSNQNGLPVMLQQLRNDYAKQVDALEKKYKEQVKAAPEKKSELKTEYKAALKAAAKDLADRIETAQMSALESSVEKKRCVKAYQEKRQAELTAQFQKDSEGQPQNVVEELKARYEMEMKVASKDNIMTKMQMIFQDPIASINPRMTVREIIAEGMVIRGIKDQKYIDAKVYEMLELVGLVREHADRYPHEFSGGQRQRIGIARAIVMEPDLIIADEPISALDVSIQAQVINLLNELRHKMGLTIMFIAHNLSVVKYFSDRIAVMYFGKIVEMTTSDELFEHPLHPYTKSLLSAIPYPDPHYEKQRKRIEYRPELTHDYSVDKPSMREITPGHFIYCNDAELEAYKKELGI